MQLIDRQVNRCTVKFLVISHRYEGLNGLIVSGNKLYQLPCMVGSKSYDLKEIEPKRNTQGFTYWYFQGKKLSKKRLKGLSIKVIEEYELNRFESTPF